MSNATLVFRGVSKSFETRRGEDLAVLDNIDLSVRSGEFVAILGPSGCGKSTILGISSGLLAWNEGAVEGPPPHEVSYVFQTARLLPWRTIRQNIEVTRNARARLRGEPYERSADDYLEDAGLSAYQHFYPGRISGGMQQRASIARAMATEPRMLLMDEPFSALDELTARSQRRSLVESWSRKGLTVIMVTHNVLEAIAMATTIVVVSSRPARVLDRVEVDMPYPRVLTDPRVGVLQKRILGLLGVTGGEQLT